MEDLLPVVQDKTIELYSNDTITPEVVSDLQIGNKKAFETIYENLYPSVIQFFNSILQSPDLSEDCCQELFANLWEKHASIDPGRNFKSYLFTVARNMAIDCLRKQKTTDTIENNVEQIKDDHHSDDLLIANETKKLILSIAGKMPKQRRKIFLLSRFDMLTNEEIAQLTGITKNAVEKHLSFAMKDIRKQLNMIK